MINDFVSFTIFYKQSKFRSHPKIVSKLTETTPNHQNIDYKLLIFNPWFFFRVFLSFVVMKRFIYKQYICFLIVIFYICQDLCNLIMNLFHSLSQIAPPPLPSKNKYCSVTMANWDGMSRFITHTSGRAF